MIEYELFTFVYTLLLVLIFMSISIAIIVLICFSSPENKGKISEHRIANRLKKDSLHRRTGKVIGNLYVPKTNGGTAEIDMVYITKKGIIVVENKNYAGYIFGRQGDKQWTVTLYAGKSFYRNNVEKHSFYNPIWQNNSHIKCLQEYLQAHIKCFSIIAFSDRGSLKKILVDASDIFVCNHSSLSNILNTIFSSNPDIFSEEDINEIYVKLLPLSTTNENIKQKHVSNVIDRFSNTDTCPACGGKLIIRTAKSGNNRGKRFYGCSNYPKCKYTKNIEGAKKE